MEFTLNVNHRFFAAPNIEARLEQLEKKLSDVTGAVGRATASEAALEARVTNHETNDKASAASLQAQIDALKAANGDPTIVANLQALADHMDAFDSEAPVAPPQATA